MRPLMKTNSAKPINAKRPMTSISRAKPNARGGAGPSPSAAARLLYPMPAAQKCTLGKFDTYLSMPFHVLARTQLPMPLLDPVFI